MAEPGKKAMEIYKSLGESRISLAKAWLSPDKPAERESTPLAVEVETLGGPDADAKAASAGKATGGAPSEGDGREETGGGAAAAEAAAPE
eukprot:2057382-Alexandrium_andersonii.AAC.1